MALRRWLAPLNVHQVENHGLVDVQRNIRDEMLRPLYGLINVIIVQAEAYRGISNQFGQ
jgi:hypothetical protein